MKKIIFIVLVAVTASGCSNSCDNAKANVAKYLNQYMNSIYKGNIGASAPGGAEALEALEIAKRACNRPDLTVEEILNPEIAKLKAQGQQIQPQSAPGDCQYFLGEEAYDKERAEFLEKNIKLHCPPGTKPYWK
jgi:hypothetical protein